MSFGVDVQLIWNTDEGVEGTRMLLKAFEGDEEVDATTISTVGERDMKVFSMLSKDD